MTSLKLPKKEFTPQETGYGEHNWRTPQPMLYDSVASYVALAERLRPHLDAYMAFIGDRLGIKLESSRACVKTIDSAERKLSDKTILWRPEMINDYLRVSGDIAGKDTHAVQDAQAIINYIEAAAETLGFKNQITHPERETGMRSLKVHTTITDPEDPSISMTAEIIFGDTRMREAYKTTLALRSWERDLRRLVTLSPNIFGENSKTTQKGLIAQSAIRQLRHAIHNEAAEKIGWNTLIDPSERVYHDGKVTSISLEGALGRDHIRDILAQRGKRTPF